MHYNGGNAQQGLQMNCPQGFPIMGGHFANQYSGPSFYENYSGNFFAPMPQPMPGQAWNGQMGQVAGTGAHSGGHLVGAGTQEYSRGIEELSRYSSSACKGYKLRKHYDLYDHYDTYIPSFQY